MKNKRRHKHTKLLQVQIRMIEDEWYDRLNKAIYKQIVANQAIQAQQISKLLKQNNSVLAKIADKTSRIKYP